MWGPLCRTDRVDFISQSWLDYTGLSREQGMGWGWAEHDTPRRRRSSGGQLAGRHWPQERPSSMNYAAGARMESITGS